MPGVDGELWLCGKHRIGPDVQAVLAELGEPVTVVCLNERAELAGRYPDYVAWLDAEHGRAAIWLPLHDFHAPTMEQAGDLVNAISTRLEAGERVVVHCGAGIGRAGTVALLVLVAHGLSVDAALDLLRAARPMAGPEAGTQRDLVNAYATARSPEG